MLIIVIILAMGLGWLIGNYFLDKWVNETQEEINEKNKTPQD